TRGRLRQVAFWALLIVGYVVLCLGPGSGVWEIYARLPLAASFRGSGRLLWIANLAGAVLVGLGADAAAGSLGRGAALLPALIIANALVFGVVPYFGYRTGDLYNRHADAFAFVQARLGPQDRVHIVGKMRDFSLGPKSASIFRVPALYDYEAQAPRRYADYFTYLRTGHPLRG